MARTDRRRAKPKESFAEIVKTVVYAVLIAVGIRTVAYEPFNIPSASMLPTLLIGDYLFVAKWAYGYSRHSMPFSPPLFEGRILESEVERGDIAVFKLPRDDSTDYIKRIVGLPGDRIQVKGGQLFINGEPVKRERVDDFVDRDWRGNTVRIPRYRETLPNGVVHYTLDMVQNGDTDDTPVFTVPSEHYFAMGDNRDNSVDSRVQGGGVGFVPAENLVGRADVLFFSKPDDAGIWEVWNWRFGRFFNLIE